MKPTLTILYTFLLFVFLQFTAARSIFDPDLTIRSTLSPRVPINSAGGETCASVIVPLKVILVSVPLNGGNP
jgi:hypothetical protein